MTHSRTRHRESMCASMGAVRQQIEANQSQVHDIAVPFPYVTHSEQAQVKEDEDMGWFGDYRIASKIVDDGITMPSAASEPTDPREELRSDKLDQDLRVASLCNPAHD